MRHQIILAVTALGLLSIAAQAAPFDVTDIEGRKVSFKETPKSFAVANYIANFLMVGGAQSLPKVVALTKDGWEDTRFGEYTVFTQSFPSIKELPSIGGFHDDILNVERILSLKPDVLLIGRSQFSENNHRIEILGKAGIRVVVLDYHAMKIENHTQSTTILGKLLDRQDIANEQNDTYRKSLEHVFKTISALPVSEKGTRVYMETASKGVCQYGNSYNRDVLWGAILKNVQASNLAENSPQPYLPLDKEYVIAKNPEVILLGGSIWRNSASGDQMRMGFTVDEKLAQERLAAFVKRDGWSQLAAVKNGQVHAVDHGSLRNMVDYTFTEYIAKVLYPTAFKDLDPQKNMANYYQKYLPELQYTGTFMIRWKQ